MPECTETIGRNIKWSEIQSLLAANLADNLNYSVRSALNSGLTENAVELALRRLLFGSDVGDGDDGLQVDALEEAA